MRGYHATATIHYVEDAPESASEIDPEADAGQGAALRDRFERAIRGLGKPKRLGDRKALKSITNNERKERLLTVQQLVNLGMSLEQIADFLPTWGLTLSRSTLYEYLPLLKVPRSYPSSESQQSHHDYYTIRFFIRVAQDAFAAGFQTRKLAKGKSPFDGARFRPDFKWVIGRYLFFLELQLSDLAETRWSVKFRNYLKLREVLGKNFRALFVIDQKGDLAYARRHARNVIERLGGHGRNSLLFIGLKDMKSSANVASDPVWVNAWGEETALLKYL